MSFKSLKKNSASSLDKLAEKAAESMGGKRSFGPDERYWKLQRDKNGNGRAVIRFLPPQEGEPEWVTMYDHGFQGPAGQWYIEKSRKTLSWDEADPVSEFLETLYAKGDEGKAQINDIGCKRRKKFISNILVVEDPGNPDNNGKVFLYEYGTKILSKVKDAMAPAFDDEEPINPFDMWSGGADFNLRIRKVDGWPNYDKSDFDDPATITLDGAELDDDQLEAIYNQTHSLNALVAPDQFKSYEELSRKFNRVMGIVANAPQAAAPAVAQERAPQVEAMTQEPEVEEDTGGEDQSSLSYFQKLASED